MYVRDWRVPPKEWRLFLNFKLFLLIELVGLDKIGEAVENGGDPQGTPK